MLRFLPCPLISNTSRAHFLQHSHFEYSFVGIFENPFKSVQFCSPSSSSCTLRHIAAPVPFTHARPNIMQLHIRNQYCRNSSISTNFAYACTCFRLDFSACACIRDLLLDTNFSTMASQLSKRNMDFTKFKHAKEFRSFRKQIIPFSIQLERTQYHNSTVYARMLEEALILDFYSTS